VRCSSRMLARAVVEESAGGVTGDLSFELETRLASGVWQLDPARSSVAFHVRHFYGLMTVKGTFADVDGKLDLGATPSVELNIQAAGLSTSHKKRDEHLRSADFFDVERHPQVRFVSDAATLEADTLRLRGQRATSSTRRRKRLPRLLASTLRASSPSRSADSFVSHDRPAQTRVGRSRATSTAEHGPLSDRRAPQ
jgi:hypothetical protein